MRIGSLVDALMAVAIVVVLTSVAIRPAHSRAPPQQGHDPHPVLATKCIVDRWCG